MDDDRFEIEPIGEVVETSTTRLVAQTCELEAAPAFGSLIRVDAPAGPIFGLVFDVQTGGLEAGAQAVMRGRRGVRDEAIFQENPDLRAVLRTSFSALIVGFQEAGRIRQYLPPHPPRLHWSVYTCTTEQTAAFGEQLDYLQTVLGAADAPADELAAAQLRLARTARAAEVSFETRAGRELARLLKRDYDRLSAILRRLRD